MTLVASGLVATVMTLCISGCAGEDPGLGGTAKGGTKTQEVSSGPLTVEVPEGWSKFDESNDPERVKSPWVVGARDSNTEMTTQLRLSKDTGQSPYADATNQAVLYGNLIANSGEVSPRGVDKVEVKGADDAEVAYFEYVDEDGDYWNGLLLSAANRETGNVSTMELMSLRDEGISQEDAKKIVANAKYDKSKE